MKALVPVHVRAALIAACMLACALPAAAAETLSTGQTLYVPCYSHIYHGIKTRSVDLTVTLSVRNTDPRRRVTVSAVEYYDTSGKLVKSYLDAPVELDPMGTAEFIVDQTDSKGGSGANFLVRWKSQVPASPVLAEAVMIGTSVVVSAVFPSKQPTSNGNPVRSTSSPTTIWGSTRRSLE